MLAWLTEMLVYRVDQVTDQNKVTFLKLLNGPDWQLQGDLETAIRETVLALRQRYRAVGTQDFELLALTDWHEDALARVLGPYGVVTRARCLPHRNLGLADSTAQQLPYPGHFSVVVVPQAWDHDWPVLRFDGQDDAVQIPPTSPLNFDPAQEFTVTAWFQTGLTQVDVTSPDNIILEKWQGIGGFAYALRYKNQSGQVEAARSDGSTVITLTSPQALNDGQFHHLAFVKRLAQLYLYIDGVEVASTADRITGDTTNDAPIYLACRARQSHYFQGAIGQVCIWNRPHYGEDLLEQMVSPPQGSEPGLVGCWSLNQGYCSTAHDHTPNRNHGRIYSATWQAKDATTALCRSLWTYLDERRLLTTRHHVVPATHVPIHMTARIYLQDGADAQSVRTRAQQQVATFCHPFTSESHWDGKGWPFGRNLYVSELYELLDNVPGVDYVRGVNLVAWSAATTELTHATDIDQANINVLNVTSTVNFAGGDLIRIAPNGDDEEYHTVRTVDRVDRQLILTENLTHSHLIGTMIVRLLSYQTQAPPADLVLTDDQLHLRTIVGLEPGDTIRIAPNNINTKADYEIAAVDRVQQVITLTETPHAPVSPNTRLVQLRTGREKSTPSQPLARIELAEHELVSITVHTNNFTTLGLQGENWLLAPNQDKPTCTFEELQIPKPTIRVHNTFNWDGYQQQGIRVGQSTLLGGRH